MESEECQLIIKVVLKGVGVALIVLVISGVAFILVQGNRRPAVSPYTSLELTGAPATATLKVQFAGVTTLLFDDGETAWMIDGFFSRPSALKTLAGKIEPDHATIQRNLLRLNVRKLAAVVPAHSHYDHAMDSPLVALQTGAVLIGSESTLNIGRGLGMKEDRMRKVVPDEVIALGKWKLTFIASSHAPTPFKRSDVRAPASETIKDATPSGLFSPTDTGLPADRLTVNAEGNLKPDANTRAILERLLGTDNAQPSEADIARAKNRIREQLNEPAASEAVNLIDNYVAYQMAVLEMKAKESANPPAANNSFSPILALHQQTAVRERNLGRDTSQAMYGDDDAIARYELARQQILNMSGLSQAQMQEQLGLLVEQAPPSVQARIRTSKDLTPATPDTPTPAASKTQISPFR